MSTIVGIDLGTTNSLVASVSEGEPTILAPEGERGIVPSVVSFRADRVLVGEEAQEERVSNSRHTIFSIKRFMGRGYEDVKDEMRRLPFDADPGEKEVVHVLARGRSYSAPEVSALVLRRLKARAEKALARPVLRAVVTVPAYFNDAQRQATKDAGKLAGLEVLRIINEPTAASLAYGLHKRNRGTIAVYDLGGGTFDISLLKIKGGVFEVLSTGGDTHLGGDDFDQAISLHIQQEILGAHGVDLGETPEALAELMVLAERAKRTLSEKDATEYELENPGGVALTHKGSLTREEMEALLAPIAERTMAPCKRALADAGLSPDEVHEVVLVGGSTRMPLIRRMVEDLFQKRPHVDLDPDEVVALGAAVQADILAGGRKDMLLLDVTPLSLGIETMGGVMGWIIPRNTTIPTSAKETYTTFKDNQTGVDIHVLQGEREMVKDNRSLARFRLAVDPAPAGLARVEVTFLLDANGILNVTARDIRSGKAASVEVQPSYGLTDEQVERMLIESFEHAEQDIRSRQVLDARTEAETILMATARAMNDYAEDAVSSPERAKIHEAVSALEESCRGEDPGLIRDMIDALNEVSMPLAERMMDNVLKSALENKRVSEALKD